MTNGQSLRNVDDVYPLTPTQSGLLYHALATPDSAMYFEQVRADLEGELDADAFRASWNAVVRRHPALRTAFVWDGVDEPLQIVRSEVDVPWEEHDWSDRSEPEVRSALDEFAAERRSTLFDLRRAPIMRVALVAIGEHLAHVVWDFHHIVVDGWSAAQVMDEVLEIYDDLRSGKEPDPEPARPFRDHVAWLQRQDQDAANRFWTAELGSFDTPTVLPIGRPAPASAVAFGKTGVSLSESTSSALTSLARTERVTLNTIIQAAWGIVLSRYTGQDDVIFGLTVSGRPADVPGVERIVGMFLNVLPLRLDVRDDRPLRTWLKDVLDRQLAVSDYEYSSLVEVQHRSAVTHGRQLFDTVLIYENYPTIDADPDRVLRVTNRTVFEQTNFPLALLVGPGAEIEVLALFNSERFDTATIDRLLSHLATVLESIAADPDATIGEIELMPAPEHQQATIDWNSTARPYPDRATVHELFDQQAAATPDAVAMIMGDRTMTYRELQSCSNRLAHRLIDDGLGARDPVGVAIRRSFDMAIALLAIVKAGGVYVPLDPDYPAERIALIVDDAAVRVVLTERSVVSGLPETSARTMCVDELDTGDAPESDPEIRTTTDDPLFITFTSGSTGRPKGVLNHHRGVLNRLQWQWDTYPLEPGEVGGQKTTLNFVDHVFEIWGTLLRGHSLVFIPDDVVKDPGRLVDALASHDIRRIAIVPSYLSVLLDVVPDIGARLPRLRYWAGSGEPTSGALADRFRAALPDAILLNFYGMSEATVDATWYDDRWRVECPTLPIGKPISNMRAYVLDGARRPAPIGVPGEIYVGGVGVAHGYVGRPDLTSERFLTDPYDDSGAGRLYRTGDRGRWLPNGHIEYLGRTDDQIKIRGFRVEPAEIEAALRSDPSVSDAFVVARRERDDTQLIAYVVGDDVNGDGLRESVRSHLPAYMVPTYVEVLDSFPRTPNGKIDRQALPLPGSRGERQVAQPTTATEQAVVDIWIELLGLDVVDPDDDFFDVGGHSLTAVRLFSRIHQRFEINLPLASLFDAPTPRALAQLIDGETGASPSSIAPGPVGRGDRDFVHVVEITPGDPSRTPLFCVHGAGGNIVNLRHLADELGADQPFIGLQASGVDGVRATHSTLDELCDSYLDEMRSLRPDGPFALAGFSSGGLIAYELGQRLIEAGERVDLVVLLDTFHPSVPMRRLSVSQHWANLRRDGPRYVWDRTVNRWRERRHEVRRRADWRRLQDEGETVPLEMRDWVVTNNTIRLLTGYDPSPYPGRVLLFSAIDTHPVYEHAGVARGWDGTLPGLEIVPTPGDHFDLVLPPHVSVLAARLREELDAL